jgi:hypothetical protein
MFVGKAGAYPNGKPYVTPLSGKLLALPTNIRLSWKGPSGANTLAYLEPLQITAIKGLIILAPHVTK